MGFHRNQVSHLWDEVDGAGCGSVERERENKETKDKTSERGIKGEGIRHMMNDEEKLERKGDVKKQAATAELMKKPQQ